MAKMPAEFSRSRFQIKPYDESKIPAHTKASESNRGAAMREIERRQEVKKLKEEFEL